MDDSMNLDYLKRDPRWSPSEEEASIISSEPTVTWGTDAIATPVTAEASHMAAGGTWAAEAASSQGGLLESLGGNASASITPAWSATTTDRISTIPSSTSSSSAISESTTPLTTTSTSSTTSPETAMTLTGTVVSTTSAVVETTAPGAYSGGGNSIKNKLAIAIPIAVVGLLLILALLFFFIRRRRRRTTHPPYEMSGPGTETPGVSTAALMATTPRIIAPPEPAATNLHRLPIIDVTGSSTHETTPGSASARSDDDPRTELGIAMAVPMDQRLSATEHDLREFSRPVSSVSHRVSAGPPSAGLASVRMPFENQSSDENDAVSIISGEHGRTEHERDFDDMSSVSSFDDDHSRVEAHGQAFR